MLTLLQGLVYDDSCNQVDGLTTNQNPCTEGIFGCSPPPIIFDQYTNTFTGLVYVHSYSQSVLQFVHALVHRYACRTDPNSGVCGSDVISVCVSLKWLHSFYYYPKLTDMVLVPQ